VTPPHLSPELAPVFIEEETIRVPKGASIFWRERKFLLSLPEIKSQFSSHPLPQHSKISALCSSG